MQRLLAGLTVLAVSVGLATGTAGAAASSFQTDQQLALNAEFAAVTAGSTSAATASCPLGATMNIVAHEDDDILFLSPDLIHDIQAGRCVRTVYVTAGAFTDDTDYGGQREAGSRAANAKMAGVANSWTTADAGISGHPMPVLTLAAKPTVSVVFMRLPQSEWGTAGTRSDPTLRNLWNGTISVLPAYDGSSTYTKAQLVSTLTGLMTGFQPDTVRTQDYVGTFGDGDHDDHHVTAYLARQAHLAYSTSHTFTGYQDYETEGEPQNVFGADLTTKTNVFNAYATYDTAPCGAPPNCGNNEYASWIKRQYVKATESGTDTTPPTVASVTPAAGASNVSLGTSVSATFSEAISTSSVTGTSFVLRDGNGNAVAASVSANGSTATLQPNATLAPSTTYTATLLGGSNGIKDLAGNALAADYNWSFTTATGPSCPCSLWTPTATPQTLAEPDTTAYELGVRFKSEVAGFITGIRFYKGSGNTGTHVGHLWTSTGTQLASATFANETATGWQQVSFSTPVAISANTAYVASYTDPVGHFSLDRPYFTTAYDSSPLHAFADGDGGANGLYTEGAAFPTTGSQASNYWVDVVFTTSVRDTTPPTVATVTPANGATNVSLGTSVSATFSEPISASSVTGTTFVLRDASGNSVPATVSASGATATLQPSASLASSTTYTATAVGGASGIKDTAGNALASNFSWSFTTLAADTTPPTVATVTPASGAPSVSLGTSVSATFSEAISASSVTGTSFVLRDGNGNSVPATVAANGATATLQPSASLAFATTYTATLLSGGSGIKDTAGNALASDFSWSFTTLAADTTPPTVATVTPAGGATNVSLGTSVSATFSEAISASSVTGTSFVLRDGSGNTVPATVSASGSTATLKPSASLASSTTYTANLLSGPSGITDSSGNALASDYTWSFTTATVDQTPPISAVTFPANAGSYNAAGWDAGCAPSGICGSASDAGSGVQKVEVSIQRLSTSRYWTGTGYTSTSERWIVASGTTSWNFALASASFPGAGSYSIRVRATDNAGIVSTPATTTFVYDNTNPSSAVTFPVAKASYTTTTWNAGCPVPGMCGTASDAVAGVQKVEISIRRGSASYWNGTSFSSASEVFLPTTGTTAWTFSFPASSFPASANYTIRVRATDKAGNVQSPSSRQISFAP